MFYFKIVFLFLVANYLTTYTTHLPSQLILSQVPNEEKNDNIHITLGLKDAISSLELESKSNRRNFQKVLNKGWEILTCKFCSVFAEVFTKFHDNPLLRATVIQVCTFLKVREDVCEGLFYKFKDIIHYIIEKRKNISGNFACGILLLNKNCVNDIKIPEWTVHIQPKTTKFKQLKLKRQTQPLKIIQLTDIHIDPIYKPYGNADCDYPICARENHGKSSKNAVPAGRWGDYRPSGMPWASIESLLNHLKDEQDIDYIYFTGDIMPHNIWETSKNEITNISSRFLYMLKDTFNGIPVFPILGNHDVHPVNLYSPTYVNAKDVLTSQWLYDFIANIWSVWLPRTTTGTIKKGGYYTVVVKPGFRIIGLNSNMCLSWNIWLLFDNEDLLRPQLQWLADTLQKAEDNDEFVHILSHVPPGDRECFTPWSREFHRIILRYSDIIKGQFNGHTHMEEIRLFIDNESKTVKNVAFNGGGISTFFDLNPNYRVYYADSDNYDILDFESWIYNVEEANKTPDRSPRWFPLYSFKTEFALDSLVPMEMNRFLNYIEEHEHFLKTYWAFKFSNSSSKNVPRLKADKYNEEICEILSTEFDRSPYCIKASSLFCILGFCWSR